MKLGRIILMLITSFILLQATPCNATGKDKDALKIVLELKDGRQIKGLLDPGTYVILLHSYVKVKPIGETKYIKYTPKDVKNFTIEPTTAYPDMYYVNATGLKTTEKKQKTLKPEFARRIAKGKGVDLYIGALYHYFKFPDDPLYYAIDGIGCKLNHKIPGWDEFVQF